MSDSNEEDRDDDATVQQVREEIRQGHRKIVCLKERFLAVTREELTTLIAAGWIFDEGTSAWALEAQDQAPASTDD